MECRKLRELTNQVGELKDQLEAVRAEAHYTKQKLQAKLEAVKPRPWYSCGCNCGIGDVKAIISSEPPADEQINLQNEWLKAENQGKPFAVQSRARGGTKWIDVIPSWNSGFEYRRKPEPAEPDRWFVGLGCTIKDGWRSTSNAFTSKSYDWRFRHNETFVKHELVPIERAEKTREYFGERYDECGDIKCDRCGTVLGYDAVLELRTEWGKP